MNDYMGTTGAGALDRLIDHLQDALAICDEAGVGLASSPFMISRCNAREREESIEASNQQA